MSRKTERLPHVKISIQVEGIQIAHTTCTFDKDGVFSEGKFPIIASAQYACIAAMLVFAANGQTVVDDELSTYLSHGLQIFGIDPIGELPINPPKSGNGQVVAPWDWLSDDDSSG